jgi:hypothetical protein
MERERLETVDLSLDCEDLSAAERKLLFAIASVRAAGGRLLKVCHAGFTSPIRRLLRVWQKEHKISFFVAGESLGGGEAGSVYLTEMFPIVTEDPDYPKKNADVTVLCL